MSEQASLHLCNLAEIHGLKKAREILGIPQPGESAPAKKPAPVAPVPPVKVEPPAAPVVATEPAAPATPAAEVPAPAAPTREEIDAGARNASVKQLKEALAQLGIAFAPNAKKADLLALFLARS